MIDWNELNCRSMLENYYAALLKREKEKYINHEKKAKTAEELEKLKEKIKKKQTHSLRVLAFCRDIAAALTASNPKPELNETMLYAAAFLHDIAKFDSDKHHHRLAASAVKTVCGSYSSEDSAAFFALDEIITAHKGKFNPCPEYAAEAAILRMADKLDKIFRKAQKVQQANCSLERAKEKLKMAQEFGDSGKKLLKKADKVLEKSKKLEKKEDALKDAAADFKKNLDTIHVYSQSAVSGICDPAFFNALQNALGTLSVNRHSPPV